MGPLSIYLQSMAITHKLHIKGKIREGNIISLLCCLATVLNTSAHYTFLNTSTANKTEFNVQNYVTLYVNKVLLIFTHQKSTIISYD